MAENAKEQLYKLFNEIKARRNIAERQDVQADFAKLSAEAGKDQARAEQRQPVATPAQAVEASHSENMESFAAVEQILRGIVDDAGKTAVEVESAKAQLKQLQSERDAEKRAVANAATALAGGKRTFSAELDHRLREMPTTDPEVRAYQEATDKMVILDAILEYARTNPRKVSVKRSLRDDTPLNRVQDSRLIYPEWKAAQRALYSSGSTAGDELVPTETSAAMYSLYELERTVAARIRRLPMPTNPWNIPCATSYPTFYKGSEKTVDDASNVLASTPATATQALTAVKLIGRTVWSTELDEDSIVAIIPFLQNAFAVAYKGAEENVLINGDTTATHLDTGYTVATNDERRCWDGFRDKAIGLSTAACADLGTWSRANLMGLLALGGKYACDLKNVLCIPSPLVYLKYFVGSDDFATWEKVGNYVPPASQTGTVGIAFGMPVAPSDKLSQELNATGLYDNSTKTKTACLFVHTPSWLIGYRRGFVIKMQEDILTDQLHMVASAREVAIKLAASAQPTELYAYNVA